MWTMYSVDQNTFILSILIITSYFIQRAKKKAIPRSLPYVRFMYTIADQALPLRFSDLFINVLMVYHITGQFI